MATRMSAGCWAMTMLASGILLPLVASQSHGDTRPNLPHDPKTTPDCTYWIDVMGSTTCQDVLDQWHVTLAQMTVWNPSLSIGADNTCQGWYSYVSYCVEAPPLPGTTTTTTAGPTTTTTKPATTTSASGPSSTATWTKRGCYLDSDPRTLAEQVFLPSGEGSMTVETCQAACWAKNYVFAGVEAGKTCFCGNSIRNEVASDAAKTCTTVCSGDSSQLCGGTNRIIIYEGTAASTSTSTSIANPSPITTTVTSATTTTTTAVPKPTETWTPLGCYEDSANPRTLVDQVQVPGGRSAMTVDSCLAACNSTVPSLGSRYEFAGVENGEECWCGNNIKNTASNVAGCQTPCRGNSTQMCGSGAHINVYQLQRLVPQWLPLGCYTDVPYATSLRTLAHQVDMEADGGATVARCQKNCLAAGYSYAGLERGDQCWCDNNLGDLALPAEEGSGACNTPCAKNTTEMCGGTNRLSLYLLSLNTGPIDLPKPSDPAPIQHSGAWSLQGCFTDLSNGNRALPRVFNDGASMTIERCMALASNFQYAAVENGEECWFGNTIDSGSSNTGDLSKCKIPCRGSSDSELCGGYGTLLMYKKDSSSSGAVKPSSPSTVAGKPWLGCYEDSNLRTLGGSSTTAADMTLEKCASFCQSSGYAYFGGEYARECYCGNSIRSGALRLAASECDMACIGSNGAQLCGRDGRISLYGTKPVASQPSTISGFPFKNCFQSLSPPMLDGPSQQSSGMTLDQCAATCKNGNYRYFGVESSNICRCGNKILDERYTASLSDCNMACDGNLSQLCGGTNRLSLYGQ